MLHSIVYIRLLELLFANGVFKVFTSIEVLFTLTTHPSGQFAHELVLLGSVGIDVVAKP